MITAKANIADIERHLNNHFNPENDPAGKRKHPPEFKALAMRILDYRNSEQGKPSAIVSESVAGFHKWQKATGADGKPLGWAALFADELDPYRRAVTGVSL